MSGITIDKLESKEDFVDSDLLPIGDKGTAILKKVTFANLVKKLKTVIGSTDSGSDYIPDYVKEESERVAKQVLSHQNANTFTFLAITDAHYLSSNENIVNGIIHAGYGLDLVRNAVNIDFAVNLGDNSWGSSVSGSETTIEVGLEEIRSVNKNIDSAFRGLPNFRTPGNHDNLAFNYEYNGNDYLDGEELFPLYGAYNKGAVYPDGEKDRGYCYRDFEAFKLRVITMNTCDLKDLDPSNEESMYTSGTQMKWFAETIDLSGKSDAEEWGIIIYSHHPLDFGISILCCRILRAYIAGTSFESFTRDGITISYDYTGKNKASIIGNIHGHNHNLKLDNLHWLISGSTTEAIDVKRMCIPNACFMRSNERGTPANTADVFDIDYGEDVTYNKTAGTAQDTAFCVVTVDTKNKMVYSDHYGAGYSQSWSYAADGGETVKTYTVQNNLTNANNSNTTTTVEQGSSYVATISAISGYVIDSVTVTMAGTDVTSSVYADGKINISNVTGNIVITVVASLDIVIDVPNVLPEAQVFTDGDSSPLDGVGYRDGYYQSSSGGIGSAAAGFTCTGLIPITKGSDGLYPTIYIKGCEWANASQCRLYFYNSSKGIINPASVGGTATGTTLITWVTITELGDNYYMFEPTSALSDTTQTNYNTVAYFAISIKGSGADLIITLDEPIE